MKTYEVRIRRYDRRDGVSNWSIQKIDATSVSTVVGRAVRDYVKGLTAKERRDSAKSLEIKCVYMGMIKEEK